MADTDLDVVIRQLAKQMLADLTLRARERRDHFNNLAATADRKEVRDQHRQMAKTLIEQAAVAARRVQLAAENAADRYARSMRLAKAGFAAQKAELAAKKAAQKPAADPATPKPAGKTATKATPGQGKKAAKKPARKPGK
ncbi:MAG: hypothetical protein FWD68_11440 [Alphaproteobacteria bacterium]|nr:hypothetical protein [Alphaproteobacteria bacterium]